CARRDYGLDYW
nr:immunoglobulin heavy chain junction region [Mus musculus]MBK4184895.1 immunoglobulin heavy chain junction region [Mus musculus]